MDLGPPSGAKIPVLMYVFLPFVFDSRILIPGEVGGNPSATAVVELKFTAHSLVLVAPLNNMSMILTC